MSLGIQERAKSAHNAAMGDEAPDEGHELAQGEMMFVLGWLHMVSAV